MSDKIVVCIPTYNERENLPLILTRLWQACPDVHALVIDDGSPDGTGDIADSIAITESRLSVLHRTKKEGLGAAYRAGFAYAIAGGATHVVEMDCDGSHQPEQLPALLEAATHADVVLGSRWIPGGAVRNWPKHREVLSRGGNAYARFMLGIAVHDATGGFRVYSSEALRAMDYGSVTSQGYIFQVEMTTRALQCGLRVVEVPIEFVERTLGASKMSRAIVLEAMAQVTRWGIRRLLRRT